MQQSAVANRSNVRLDSFERTSHSFSDDIRRTQEKIFRIDQSFLFRINTMIGCFLTAATHLVLKTFLSSPFPSSFVVENERRNIDESVSFMGSTRYPLQTRSNTGKEKRLAYQNGQHQHQHTMSTRAKQSALIGP